MAHYNADLGLSAALLALVASRFLPKEDLFWGLDFQSKAHRRVKTVLSDRYRCVIDSVLSEGERRELEQLEEALKGKELVERFPIRGRYCWSVYLATLKKRLLERYDSSLLPFLSG